MAPCPLLLLLFSGLLALLALSRGDESLAGVDESSSLPLLASGKRQHNIMRFGKRPSSGQEEPKHRFLFLGKREDSSPDLFHFLQRDDNSYKRGHTIMRFGKRADGSHNFMRFGRKDDASKAGHAMIYFGKRADGHNMMYFGKRGGHSMMYFGKKNDQMDPAAVYTAPEEEEEKRAAHSMIHFGKRDDKRGSHSMIHFGKRPFHQEEEEDGDLLPIYASPEEEKRNHNLLRFGKKTEGSRARGSHAMIHFGKRSESPSEALVTRRKREFEETDEEGGSSYYYPSSLLLDEYDPEKRDGSKNVFLRFG